MFEYALCTYLSIYQLILLADNQYIAHVSLLLTIFYFYSMENHYGLNGISSNLMYLENLLGKQLYDWQLTLTTSSKVSMFSFML